MANRRYTKPPELAAFEREYNAHEYDHLPSIPAFARTYTKFRDDTANGLTASILAHLKFTGNFGARVNSTGVYDTRLQMYRQGQARRGMADISALISGRPVQIEIKAGKDRPRASQLQVQAEYRAAGGMYEFVHSFAEYMQIFNQIKNLSK